MVKKITRSGLEWGIVFLVREYCKVTRERVWVQRGVENWGR